MPVTGTKQKPVDIDHLAAYTGGDAGLNAEILSLFRDQSAAMIGRLHHVLEAGDQKVWRETNHALKGAARGIGAFELAAAADNAEPVAVSADAAADALHALEARMRAVHLFIDAYLGG